MDKIAREFKDKGVAFCMLYTREPHAGQRFGELDFSDKKQTRSHEERVEYAIEMIDQYSENRPVLIDTFGEKCLQNTLGGRMPNSLIVIDREGKVALWQKWSNPGELRRKLAEMTAGEGDAQEIDDLKATTEESDSDDP